MTTPVDGGTIVGLYLDGVAAALADPSAFYDPLFVDHPASLAARHPRLCHVAITGHPHPEDETTGHDLTYLAVHGRPIRYGYVTRDWPLDAYQNVYAREPGSAEMPSAGRPFTPELVTRLVAKGVAVTPLVLHTVNAPRGASQPSRKRPAAIICRRGVPAGR